MDWLRIDVGFARHPKVLAAGPRLALAQLRAMGWSAEQETGGHIPTAALPVIPLSKREAEQLVELRLLDRNGDGYYVHDWDAYQPSAEELAEERRVADERRRASRQWTAQHRARKREEKGGVTRDT